MSSATEITRAFYDLFVAGKLEEMLTRFVSEDCVLENPLPDPIPFGGRFEGRPGFEAYLHGILGAIEIENFEIREIFGDGDRVAVIGSETSRVVTTEKRYTMNWVHTLRIRDGKIYEFREYNDTAAMRAAFVD